MAQLTVVPDPARAAVRISTDFSASPDVIGRVTVVRTDAAGVTVPVRGLQKYSTPMGVTVGIDQEAPFDQRLTYVATGLTDAGAVVATSTPATSWVPRTEGRLWLRVLGRPALSASFLVRELPEWNDDIPQGINYPRDARFPIVISGQRRAPSGTVTLKITTAAELTALLAVVAAPGPKLAQFDPAAGEPDVYVSIGKTSRQRLVRFQGEPHRFVPLPLTVVDRPAKPDLVVLPGRTFADLAAKYPNAAAYPSPLIEALR